ncbi:MAG: hypothetical protein WHS44_05180 [Fimbriimonadales bacterium]|nr:MAG: hypothetical protein KatS3mg018_2537 [Fimbriimonadales bacterium]
MRLVAVFFGLLALGGLWAQEARLQNDSRLQATLKLEKPFTTLRETLAAVQEATGVPLYADRAIADDKVCVLTRERPAHEILTRLAETLRYTWQLSTDGNGYRLAQTASERAREGELLRAYERARADAFRKPLFEMAHLLRRHDRAQLERLNRETLTPEVRRYLELAQGDERLYLAGRALASLPDAALNQLAQGEPIVFSSPPRRGAFPMPPELRAKAFAGWEETPLPVQAVEIVFEASPEAHGLVYRERVVQGREAERSLTQMHIALWELHDWERTLEAHPQNRVWREWRSEADAFNALTPARARTPLVIPEPIRRSPLATLIAYAREYGLELYADAYRIRPAREMGRDRAPLWTIESLRERVFWLRLEEGALLARHRDYYLLRPSEVPESALAPLEQKIRAGQEVALDEWANLAVGLTPLQAARAQEHIRVGGMPVAHETLAPLENLIAILPALRFWMSLTPQQRNAALNQEWLPFQQLSPRQRELFALALEAPLPDGVSRQRYAVYESAPGAVSLEIGAQGEVRTMMTRITSSEPPLPSFRIGRAVQRVAGSLTDPSTLSSQEPSKSADSARGWQLYFVADNRQRVYMLVVPNGRE